MPAGLWERLEGLHSRRGWQVLKEPVRIAVRLEPVRARSSSPWTSDRAGSRCRGTSSATLASSVLPWDTWWIPTRGDCVRSRPSAAGRYFQLAATQNPTSGHPG